ncbi:bowman-birk serine protease inhibitor family protein (macronuclear) [Tetrahymena thermophila SB210]|uniref:Bowman-birk serine protease inhibitor family protein n=1 Tax=Tetrahymena thermophila (strain SB210) TaxID=312017 RepID=I7LVF1_TETTS|nr:bowman-birk serine protease inhibitor family protein [Tetrahymena thermophila SB210]EAR98007.3 bowman-birk serine protease inhibitor family protein [Tetrahymena thermophila SB210]|eukprot:XP_001018252.3 bowman-birk serine protease inhibitor family protein [Tetrahymena thermophila SB210]
MMDQIVKNAILHVKNVQDLHHPNVLHVILLNSGYLLVVNVNVCHNIQKTLKKIVSAKFHFVSNAKTIIIFVIFVKIIEFTVQKIIAAFVKRDILKRIRHAKFVINLAKLVLEEQNQNVIHVLLYVNKYLLKNNAYARMVIMKIQILIVKNATIPVKNVQMITIQTHVHHVHSAQIGFNNHFLIKKYLVVFAKINFLKFQIIKIADSVILSVINALEIRIIVFNAMKLQELQKIINAYAKQDIFISTQMMFLVCNAIINVKLAKVDKKKIIFAQLADQQTIEYFKITHVNVNKVILNLFHHPAQYVTNVSQSAYHVQIKQLVIAVIKAYNSYQTHQISAYVKMDTMKIMVYVSYVIILVRNVMDLDQTTVLLVFNLKIGYSNKINAFAQILIMMMVQISYVKNAIILATLVIIINLILAKIVETLQKIIGYNNNKLIYHLNLNLNVFVRINTMMMVIIIFVINVIIPAKLVHNKTFAPIVISLLLGNCNRQKLIKFTACAKLDILKIQIKFVNNALKTKCDCKDGMYEDKSGICQICHFSCDTCEGGGSVNDCKTCNYQNNRVVQQKDSKITCQCMQTFYESNKALCDKCHYSCLTCSKNSNENSCDSCDSSLFRVLNSGKCICKSGYVEVNHICVPCHKSCQECIGITNKDCTKCNIDDQRVQSVKDQTSFQCFCKSSYYEDSNLVCQKCHFSCQECIGPKAEDCTQCSRQNFRIPSELSLKNFLCVCQEKFYSDNINSLCLPCHYSCKNCEGGNNKQNCTECNQSFGRIKLLQQGQNQGQCICKEAFFENGSNELCTACDITCKNCFNSSNQGCNQCYDERNFMLTQQKQCICKPQHFYNQIQNACLKCHEFCQSCKGLGKEDCLSCFPYQNRELIGTQCLCKQSFFQINQNSICQACHYSCLNCNGYSRFQCTDCSSDSLRIFNRIYSTCDCQQGYFEIKNTQKCQKCDQNCKTCEMKSDKCIQCNNNMVLNKESYKCECQSGYYLDIKTNYCYPCSYACKQCLGPQNGQCLTCKDNYLGVLSGIFNNQQTYQCNCDPNLNCLGCHPSCEYQQCDPNNQNICLSCPQNMQLTPIQTTNNMKYQICVCMEGFYEDIILLKCLKCHFTCQTCVGPSAQDCLSCKDEDLNFRQAKPVLNQIPHLVECSCKKGYFEIQNQLKCQKCHSSCETCQGQFNYCISCPENSFISQNGVCICKQNFIFMSTLGICQQCHYSCNQCDGLQLDDCLSCSSLTTRVFVPKNANMKNSLGTCKCQQGYYDIGDSECQKCHYSCETCIGQANFCITCPPQKLSHRFYSSNGKCDCLPKYFEDVNNNCVPCPYDCYTCNLEKKCLTCEESQRQLDTKTNRCTCYKGTFEVQDRSCQPCDLNCESCKDNPKVCSTCHPNSDLNYFSKCVCNEGFYEDPEFYKQYSMIPRKQISILNKTDLCKKCFTTCKSCDNKLTCLSCDVMKFTVLNPKTKICECFYGRQLILNEDGSFTCELLDSYITQSTEQQISTIHQLISKMMNFIYPIFGFLSFMSIFTGNLTLPNIMLQRVFDIELLLYLNVMPIDNVKQFLSITNKSIYMYIGYINPFQNILSSEDDYYVSNNLKEYKISTNIYKQGGGTNGKQYGYWFIRYQFAYQYQQSNTKIKLS